jgi:hypothetical protein
VWRNEMKKIIVFLLVAILCQDIGYAYQIKATDEQCYIFDSGKIKTDSNRYEVIYEVDETKMTISVIEETDLRTGEKVYPKDTIYQIVPKATMFEFKSHLKGFRLNPKRASIESISFCDGKYLYSKMQEVHINLFYGNYEIVKNKDEGKVAK